MTALKLEPVKAATDWRTNGDLIAALVELGYLKFGDRVLDPTFGRGRWWTTYWPDDLTTHDIAIDKVDFRDLPYAAGTFDVVAYDPPYVSVGGRTTTTIPDFHDRYGMTDAPTSPAALQLLINAGLSECMRVTNNYVFVKCQDYISSGKLWLGTHWTLTHALSIGLECVDRLEHITSPRPQPPGRRQVHARRNLSTMFVFQKGGSNART